MGRTRFHMIAAAPLSLGSAATRGLDARLERWSRDVGQSYQARAGTVVLQQGAPARDMLLLTAGQAFLRRVERSGIEVSVALCQPGSFLGLASVLHGTPHAVSVHMKTAGQVLTIPSERVIEAMVRPDLGPALVDQLAADHLLLIDRYSTQAALPVRDRVLALLREIRTQDVPWAVPLATSEIASLIGANVSHVCRVLRSLRSEGIVEFSRSHMMVRVALD